MNALQDILVSHVAAATVDYEPFPHIYLPKVFPDDFYEQLRKSLPTDEDYKPIGEYKGVSGDSYATRSVYALCKPDRARLSTEKSRVMDILKDSVLEEAFIKAFLQKFDTQIKARFGVNYNIRVSAQTSLIRDRTNYGIGPHTDVPNRLISVLIYLPGDDSLRALGTSLYTPRQQGFTCEGGPHYKGEDFNLVKTAPFLPNTAVAFPVSNTSFHGIEPINRPDIKRDLQLVNITWS